MKNWRLLLCTILGILIIGEYLIYFIVAMSWNVPTKKSKHDLKVLFVSDPQIQGFQFEPFGIFGHITRWDVCRYLKKTFGYAVNRVEPDVVVLLGDLLDEGYVSSDEKFLQYKEWFEDIYTVPSSVKRIHLAGDNDIGGESEPIEANLLTRHEKYFGPTNEIIKFNNWQFLKLSTLSFLRYFRFTTADERRIFDNLNMFMTSSVKKLDENKHTLVLSHLPLGYWDPHFALKVLNNINPRVIFTGHDHKPKYRMYKVGSFSTEEHVVPTCSYRMGTIDMGFGVAMLGENGSFHYTVLKLPRRYFFLYFYIVACTFSVLYIILFRKKRT